MIGTFSNSRSGSRRINYGNPDIITGQIDISAEIPRFTRQRRA
jgi:hypothetical protein